MCLRDTIVLPCFLILPTTVFFVVSYTPTFLVDLSVVVRSGAFVTVFVVSQASQYHLDSIYCDTFLLVLRYMPAPLSFPSLTLNNSTIFLSFTYFPLSVASVRSFATHGFRFLFFLFFDSPPYSLRIPGIALLITTRYKNI